MALEAAQGELETLGGKMIGCALLVLCENWVLYFAFDRDREFGVCGPLKLPFFGPSA
jgi:hypothetical protein